MGKDGRSARGIFLRVPFRIYPAAELEAELLQKNRGKYKKESKYTHEYIIIVLSDEMINLTEMEKMIWQRL